MRINYDIFSLNSKLDDIKYFLAQGNILRHLLDRLRWHYHPRLKYAGRFPDHLDIEITNVCQLKCPMCAQNVTHTKKGFMDFNLYKKIIDEIAEYKIYSIKLSWRGEVMLHKDLFKMARYAKEKGIKEAAFLTNLERFDKGMLDDLLNSGLTWMAVSVDGLKETYEKIRYPAKFDDLTEKLKLIKAEKLKRKQKLPLIRIQSIWSAIKNNPKAFKDYFNNLADKIMFISDQVRSLEDQEKEFIQDPDYICSYLWQRLTITWDGKVVQCIDDENEQNVIGNVREKSLYEIWHSHKLNALRKLHKEKERLLNPVCNKCCAGGRLISKKIKVGSNLLKANFYEDQEIKIN
ncbi:MAG: SPASM domain-containing protein [Armatimonadetes bacterium]|nr:SPASM domain-containing protein [Armatimonadota bacterium]